jgi:diadenosine tetraphosphate (Ap4A) HIT family hydrolase
MSSGTAVLGLVQFLPGYSLLLSGVEGAERLSDLPRVERLRFLSDMDTLGEAVERVCSRRDSAFRRINLEIQGNLAPQLHAHIWPRYDWEPPHRVIRQVGRYPLRTWHQPDTALSERHFALRDELRTELAQLVTA